MKKNAPPKAPVARTARTVAKPYWVKGILIEAGAVLMLADDEAKYLGHVLEPLEAPVAAEADPEVAEVLPEPEPAVEASQPARKAKKAAAEATDGEVR